MTPPFVTLTLSVAKGQGDEGSVIPIPTRHSHPIRHSERSEESPKQDAYEWIFRTPSPPLCLLHDSFSYLCLRLASL